ncbi:hypothetical protein DYQ86_25240 [Acidobacteria bacterium AB60]|nr:hypothetical protein DYQ86_25240 [Acidobacteria bacterium AB60]
MRLAKQGLIAGIAVLMLSGNLSLSAFAWGHKHRALPKAHSHTHYKTGPYADLLGGPNKAPKKQKVQKHSHWNR